MDIVTRLASQNAVVIFSYSYSCMCHTVKSLFNDLGVSTAVYELDKVPRGQEMEKVLQGVPAVFIGGKFVGSTNEIMALHVNRDRPLIKLLEDAGAIWLYK